MSTTQIVTKITHLLTLAADAGATDAERRTAAVIAARMMREHGIGLAGGPAPQPAPQPANDGQRPASSSRRPSRGRRYYGAPSRIVLEAAYRGSCAECRGSIEPGTRISWCRGEATYHEHCAPGAAAAA